MPPFSITVKYLVFNFLLSSFEIHKHSTDVVFVQMLLRRLLTLLWGVFIQNNYALLNKSKHCPSHNALKKRIYYSQATCE